jgi:hypothetical protein
MGLVIVSATSYDGAPVYGEPVCKVEAPGAIDVTLRTGIDTGPSERDRYMAMGGTDLHMRTYSGDKGGMDFVTVVMFKKPCRPDQITFTYLKDKGVIDVKGLEFVKANE